MSGFWHGAAWTFIYWGVYYGIWLVLERMFLKEILDRLSVFSVAWVFLIVVVGWVFFRADNLSSALNYLEGMFTYKSSVQQFIVPDSKTIFIFTIATFFSVFTLLPYGQKIQNYIFETDQKSLIAYFPIVIVMLALFTAALASVTTSNFNPFIYFRF